MNTLPQEIICDIISFVPEYGFMVNKTLHANLIHRKFSFYCSPHKFAMNMGVARLQKYNIAAEIMKICYELIVNDCVNLTGTEYNSDTDDYYEFIQNCVSGIDDFEPYRWSCQVLLSDRVELFCRTFVWNFPTKCYKLLEPGMEDVQIYDSRLIDYEDATDAEMRAAKNTVKKVMAYVFAYKYGLISANKVKKKIGAIMLHDDLPDLLNIIALIAQGEFFDIFFELYRGDTTAIICRDIFTDLYHGRFKYGNIETMKRTSLILETFGHHLTEEIHLRKFPETYKNYLAMKMLQDNDSKK